MACILTLSYGAAAHYVASDSDASLLIRDDDAKLTATFKSFGSQEGHLNRCNYANVERGIWEIFHSTGSCVLRPGDYDFANAPCEGGIQSFKGQCKSVRQRSDIERAEADGQHDKALIAPIHAEIAQLKSATAAAFVELGKRIDALPVEFSTNESAVDLLRTTLLEDREGIPDFQLIGDFNGDKRSDLWLLWTRPGIDGENKLFLGQADGTFSSPLNDPVPRAAINGGVTQAVAADLNHDGVDDLLAIWGREAGGQGAGFNRFFAGSSTGFQPAIDALVPAASLGP